MTISVSLFRPKFDSVSVHTSGTIVVKLRDPDGGEIALFFMQSDLVAVDVLGHPAASPAEQVAFLVSTILRGAGFESYEFEKIDGLEYNGQPVCEAFFDHPSFEGTAATTDLPEWVAPHLHTV